LRRGRARGRGTALRSIRTRGGDWAQGSGVAPSSDPPSAIKNGALICRAGASWTQRGVSPRQRLSEKWYVDIGKTVKRRQLLAELETPDLDGRWRRAGRPQYAIANPEAFRDDRQGAGDTLLAQAVDTPGRRPQGQRPRAKTAMVASAQATLPIWRQWILQASGGRRLTECHTRAVDFVGSPSAGGHARRDADFHVRPRKGFGIMARPKTGRGAVPRAMTATFNRAGNCRAATHATWPRARNSSPGRVPKSCQFTRA